MHRQDYFKMVYSVMEVSILLTGFLVLTSAFSIQQEEHPQYEELGIQRLKRSPSPFKKKGGGDTVIINEYYGGGSGSESHEQHQHQEGWAKPVPQIQEEPQEEVWGDLHSWVKDAVNDGSEILHKTLSLGKIFKPQVELQKWEIPIPSLNLPSKSISMEHGGFRMWQGKKQWDNDREDEAEPEPEGNHHSSKNWGLKMGY